MALNGLVTVTLILDETDTPLGEPWVELMGLPPTGGASDRCPRRWRPTLTR